MAPVITRNPTPPMHRSKCLLILCLAWAPITLCFGSAKTLYDHTYSKIAAYPVPNVWFEDEPTNSFVAAMIYTGDGLRPNNYFRDVSIMATSLGKDGSVDGGDWADVAYWKVFIFDVTAGPRSLMRNHFSLRALASGTNAMVRNMRRPTNSLWRTPIGTHPTTGQNIYYFTFSVWVEHWQAAVNHVYAMGAVPVFKGGRKDMPFLPLIWVSYGMDHTNSAYLGSGTNEGLYAAPDVPGEMVPLNADGDPVALFLYNHHLPWGHGAPFFLGAAVDQDSPPAYSGPYDMGTKLVSWSPTNLVLETVGTEANYVAATPGHLGFMVESTPDLSRPHWLDVAWSGYGTNGLLPVGSNYQFSVPINPGLTQQFFRIRTGDYGQPSFEPDHVPAGLSTNYANPVPHPTTFATATPIRPTNHLYTPYTGQFTDNGPVTFAAPNVSIEPVVALTQALASVQYSPDEAQGALAKTSYSLMATPESVADDGEVSVDHDGRVVQWRSKAARKKATNAHLSSLSPQQLRASDPARFYGPHASAERFISQFGRLFGGANPKSAFRAQIAERDGLGLTHVRYRQFVENTPVFGAEVVVHVDADGKITTANGLAAKDPNVSVAPSETVEHAREIAFSLWRKQPGSWSGGKVELEELEVFCPRLFLCDATPEFSETNVVDVSERPNQPDNDVLAKPTGWVNSDYLTWRIRVAGERDEPDLTYFVDAHNGKPRFAYSNRMRLTNRQIYNCGGGTSPSNCGMARSEGQVATGIIDVDATYDCFGNLNDFYRNVFGRDGANGLGGMSVGNGGLTVYVNYGAAYFAPVLGGSQYLPPTATSNTRIETTHEWYDLGSFGHEYAHALDYFTHPPSGRTYQSQSGALMESTANILSEYFVNYIVGSNNWMIQFTNYSHGSNEYMRGFQVVMSDPWMDASIYGMYGDPKNLYGRDYYCGSTAVDNGGVHANSYPISYAAYLLTHGGYFNNCTINPIGLEAVGAIWYRANGYYSASANFAEAFLDLQQAAADLYPSNVVAEVRKALQAVEMDQPGRCTSTATTPRAKPEPASTTCSAPDFNNPAVLGKCYFYEHELWDFIMPGNILIKFGSDGGNPAGALRQRPSLVRDRRYGASLSPGKVCRGGWRSPPPGCRAPDRRQSAPCSPPGRNRALRRPRGRRAGD